MKGSGNRSLRRFTCTESGKREQPEWVQSVPDQVAEFLAKGGEIFEYAGRKFTTSQVKRDLEARFNSHKALRLLSHLSSSRAS